MKLNLTLGDSLHSRSVSGMETTFKEHEFEIGPIYTPREINLIYKDSQGIQFAPN